MSTSEKDKINVENGLNNIRHEKSDQDTLIASILDSVPFTVIGLENRTIIFINNAVDQMFGWKSAEIVGKNTRFLYRNAVEYEELGKLLYSSLKENRIFDADLDFPLLHKNGSEIYCHLKAAVIGNILVGNKIVATLEDISKRREIEKKAKSSEDKYRKIFDSSPSAIMLLDKKGNLLDGNRSFFEIIGYTKEEIVNKNILAMSFITLKSKATVIKNFFERIAGVDVAPYDAEFVDKNGNLHYGRVYGTRLKDGDITIGDLAIITEITEQKKYEKELEAKIAELEKFNNLSVDREIKMTELKKRIKELEGTQVKPSTDFNK